MIKVSLKIVLNFSRFKPVLNWNRFLAELRRGLNSLNSDSGGIKNVINDFQRKPVKPVPLNEN